MKSTINQIVFNVLEAEATLYPANTDGSPQLDSPVWMGAAMENITVRGTWVKQKTRPTGARYPKNRPLIAEYVLSIGRVWVTDEVLSPNGFNPDNEQCVLDVVWQNEDTQEWQRKTFYGVTISEQDWDGRDVVSGLLENQQFDAQYFVPDNGTGSVPALSGSLPYRVEYIPASGPGLTLYTYNQATSQFTAQTDPTDYATISYADGIFGIQFAGDSQPVVQMAGINAFSYRNGVPYRNNNPYLQRILKINGGAYCIMSAPSDLPRMDFYYGGQRLFTVTRQGVFSVEFDEQSGLGLATGAFAILNTDSSVAALISAGKMQAPNFNISG